MREKQGGIFMKFQPSIDSEVPVHSYKHNGKIHRVWKKVRIMDVTDHVIITASNKTLVIESDSRIWKTTEPAISYFFDHLWFNVIAILRADGIHFYCNLSSPCVYDEGDARDSFENKTIKAELKTTDKNSGEYKLLKSVESLIVEKAAKNKSVKAEEIELKNAVYERILVLTDEEIDDLVFEKWFGITVENMVNLVEAPLKRELKTLEMLNNRYSDTLADIENQASELESELENLLSELVVL